MAGSLLTLLDDVVALLDDVALLAKSATSKTAGVLGDDLALSAQQLAGFASKRELPILWQVAKGSLWNKAIIVPCALLLSAFLPSVLMAILLIGGAFLCYEGVEKLHERFFHQHSENHTEKKTLSEAEQIQGAIRTDFILSIEIIVIALSDLVAKEASISMQIITLCVVAVLITVLVYGLVAVIIKMDDLGVYLYYQKSQKHLRKIGQALLFLAPQIIRLLSVLGTIALFLVGGHIWQENTFLHHFHLESALWGNLLTFIIGLIVGIITLFLVKGLSNIYRELGGNQ